MRQCLQDQLTDYWAKIELFYTPFYTSTIRQNRYIYTSLGFHNTVDKIEENYDRLWKI